MPSAGNERSNIRQKVVRQFRKPHGPLGNIAGWIMANRASNRKRNLWTVDLLAIDPGDTVLEIGCGPGLAAEACLTSLQTGKYVGIDHSRVMLNQTAQRIVVPKEASRMELHCGDVAKIRELPDQFDKVFSVNVAQFLEDQVEAFRLIASKMAMGGVLATTYQPRNANPTRADAVDMAQTISENLSKVGFVDIRTEELALKSVPAICVLACNNKRDPAM